MYFASLQFSHGTGKYFMNAASIQNFDVDVPGTRVHGQGGVGKQLTVPVPVTGTIEPRCTYNPAVSPSTSLASRRCDFHCYHVLRTPVILYMIYYYKPPEKYPLMYR